MVNGMDKEQIAPRTPCAALRLNRMRRRTFQGLRVPKPMTNLRSWPKRSAILFASAFFACCRRRSTVCSQIVGELPLAQSTVSEHLRILKDAGLFGVVKTASCWVLHQLQRASKAEGSRAII